MNIMVHEALLKKVPVSLSLRMVLRRNTRVVAAAEIAYKEKIQCQLWV